MRKYKIIYKEKEHLYKAQSILSLWIYLKNDFNIKDDKEINNFEIIEL